jgi:hypothetical protein
MSKCCSGVITFWHCFKGLRSDWSPNSSRRLCSCDINTLASPIVLDSSIGLSTSLSIGELSLTILNVSDGVCGLSSGNYVQGELKASPNIDISVLFKTLILKIKHILLFKNLQHFLHQKLKNFKVSTKFNKRKLIHECLLVFFVNFLFIWLNTCHFCFPLLPIVFLCKTF